MHVLLIRFSSMGDVAMLPHVIQSAISQNKDLKFTVVSRPQFEALFEDLQGVSFFSVDLNDRYSGVWGIWKLFKALKGLKIDGVADMHNVLRSRILATLFRLSGINGACLDKGRPEKRALTRKRNKIYRQLLPVTERYAKVLAALNINCQLNHKLPRLTNPVPKPNPKIIIAPFARHTGKTLPMNILKGLLKSLLGVSGVKVYLLGGGEKECVMLDDLADEFSGVENIAGKYSLKEELAFLASMDLMICMDSANHHLASLVGLPTVSIWGATDPMAGFMAYGQSKEGVVQISRNELACRPCSVYGNKKCYRHDYACLNGITVDQIMEKVNLYLG